MILPRSGRFSNPSREQCHHYARFFTNLDRRQADAVFFICFATVLALLILASNMYAKAVQTFNDKESGDPETCYSTARLHERVRRRCLVVSLCCFVLAATAAVLEAFAAFNIEFCDGEDLMMLYWGFWSLLQVGSLLAIFGIALNQWYGLENKKEPPWATALGTPVLVIAALGHFLKVLVEDRAKGRDTKSVKSRRQSIDELRLSRATTAASTPPGARFVGYTFQNEPLFAYPPDKVRNEVPKETLQIPESSARNDPRSIERSPTREIQFAENPRGTSHPTN